MNGQWTTTTMNVNTVLQHYDQQDKDESLGNLEAPPVYGILTQTLIRSPLVNWILPAKFRSSERNDVAFIGDDFVQIKELRPDRQLWDVVRKENFGARIRNARVIGSTKSPSWEIISFTGSTPIKNEDVDMDDGEQSIGAKLPRKGSALPPQMLLLQLDTGDSVFLMLRQTTTGGLEFVTSRRRVPKLMLRLQPGMHLTVDPSSRYMAVGCSEAVFAIYALHSRDQLVEQYRQGYPLNYVESEKHVSVPGVILKMEFLHPSPDDETHIILLVLVIIRGRTRMQVYEWQTGTDLKSVRPHSGRGHLLDERRQMPLLLIPLTIKSSFILIYEEYMTVCHGILEGHLQFSDFSRNIDEPTSFHHGKKSPIWTAWARPARREQYAVNRDDIYIVREDGLVKFVEIDSEDDDFIKGDSSVGDLESNCSSALAYLDYKANDSKSGDVLVTGGDSGAGGTYFLRARKVPLFSEPIQNWSPASDFATTFVPTDRNHVDDWKASHIRKDVVPRPDRLFATVGKGLQGSVIEFRRGFEAKLGFVVDYPNPVLEAWVLCPTFDSFDDDEASLFLLSLGDKSAVLCFSGDSNDIESLDEHQTKFDLRFRTITACMHQDHAVQVTEQSIVVKNGTIFNVYDADQVLVIKQNGNILGHGQMIEKAVIHESLVLFTTILNGQLYLQILEQNSSNAMENHQSPRRLPAEKLRTLSEFSPNVSSIGLCAVRQNLCAVVADESDGYLVLTFLMLSGAGSREVKLPSTLGEEKIHVGAIVSIAVGPSSTGFLTLLCGTRCGWLITVDLSESSLEILSSQYDRFGGGQVIIRSDELSTLDNSYLLSCDFNIYGLCPGYPQAASISVPKERSSQWKVNQIWLTDASRPELHPPEIHSIARLRPNISGGADGGLLLVSGSQLLLTAFSTQEKAIPRFLPIKGTPSRLLYSSTLDLLIVGAVVDGVTTLRFIDQNTGEDLSTPCDEKTKELVPYIQGLGRPDERISHLLEWPYSKNGKTWHFVIVATSAGRLLIVSATPEKRSPQMGNGVTNGNSIDSMSVIRPRIQFFTRYKFRSDEPIYSVVGYPDGLIWGSGKYLYCDALDLREKKFRRMAGHELPSPAFNLGYENGIIYAMTSAHSLELVKLVIGDDGEAEFVHTHADQVCRDSFHHTAIEGFTDRPIHLLSDKHCSLAGLWPTHNTRADTLDTLFEAELPHSILKLRSAKCRPVWDAIWRTDLPNIQPGVAAQDPIITLGRTLKSVPEILGLSIDGSLSQFTILETRTWRFLRFIIDLGIRSPQVCEFTYKDDVAPLEPATTPKRMMHVDGDILRRCLEDRALEGLLGIGLGCEDNQAVIARFCELLDELHEGVLDASTATEVYLELAYRDLELLLRPVW